ncbi:uncharacterized protein F5Z01DRAFT_220107 [Emericellopsis atlantica]|uniref:Uncharacterized protein n=1 Tax=Emericellopsis atlantica TaxID=2614577 RepID=A0A9P8CMD8_9HYPO|nr:uncharacterized protein F5Z01DRAFT_220107 [Emericellopsis atlantica]KAG9252614.1 hypothetical protein F5Z01DRAFT_220107 [Emericellopsis atlantica]
METQPKVQSSTPSSSENCNTAGEKQPHETAEDPGDDIPSFTEDDLSLRFPRPSGSRHLASWVINSDPDIMRVTSVPGPDEGSLADSTYELIHSVDDSNSEWSHDGNMDDNDIMGESTGSLDQHGTDEVHSATGETEPDVQELDESSGMTERPAAQTSRSTPDTTDTDSEHDQAPSTPSLDYAHETLDMPSFFVETPEQSEPGPVKKHAVPDQSRHTKKHAVLELLKDYQVFVPTMTDFYENRSLMIALLLSALAMLGTIIASYSLPTPQEGGNVPSFLALPSTSTSAHLVGSTASDKQSPSSTGSERTPDPQVQDESSSYDWIFGPPRPKMSYTIHGNKFTAHVAEDVKAGWQDQDCVTVQAYRDGRQIFTTKGDHEDGFFATIPAAEKYGDVEFVLEATCKPVTRRAVHIRFATFTESFEALKESVKNHRPLPEITKALVPVLEHFTNPYIVGRHISDGARDAAQSARHGMMEFPSLTSNIMNKAVQTFDHAPDIRNAGIQATKRIAGRLSHVQTGLQLGLLDAQIAAKLSWLGMMGKRNAQDEYRRKAEIFMTDKRAKARQLV